MTNIEAAGSPSRARYRSGTSKLGAVTTTVVRSLPNCARTACSPFARRAPDPGRPACDADQQVVISKKCGGPIVFGVLLT
jgi:hypothetical protein